MLSSPRLIIEQINLAPSARENESRIKDGSKSGPLQRLPTDVHLAIMYILNRFDIVSLGSTCKSLREASIQRSVWATILEEVCVANGIFRPSYQLNTMSALEIRRISHSPERFILMYKSHIESAKKIWTPRSKRNILPDTFDMDGNFTRFVFLVPGGRFLVTYSGYHKLLCMWDLESSRINEPLVKWECSLKSPILCSQNPERTAIRVAAQAKTGSHEEKLCYTVFEYHPIINVSTIYNASVRSNEGGVRRHHFVAGNVFGSVERNSIHLWDFIRNLWVSWEVNVEDIETVVFVDDFQMTLVGLEHISCWDIPQLDSWVPFSELLKPEYLPARLTQRIYHFWAPRREIYRINSAENSWYNGLSICPFRFDVVHRFSQQYPTIRVCEFYTGAGFSRGALKTLQTHIRDRNTDDEIAWDGWRVLGRGLIKCFSNYDTFQLWAVGARTELESTWSRGLTGDAESDCTEVVNLVHRGTGAERLVPGEFSFDPFSGRLCYASMSGEGSVTVVDFL